MRRRKIHAAVALTGAALVTSLLSLPSTTAAASDQPFEPGSAEVEQVEIVPIDAPSREALSQLASDGYDLAEEVEDVPGGVRAHAVLTKQEQAELRSVGIRVGRPIATEEDFAALQEEYRQLTAEVAQAEATLVAEGDDVRVQRAQWFADPQQGRFLEMEVWSKAGSTSSAVTVQVTFDAGPGTEIGSPGTQSFSLSRFVDTGRYMFHRANDPVKITTEQAPTRARIDIVHGGAVQESLETAVTEVLVGSAPRGPGAPTDRDPTYQTSFVSKYVDATESYEKIEQLAAEFPHLAEIVELPYKTNGYRRKAQALLDPAPSQLQVGGAGYAYATASYGPSIPTAGVPAGGATAPLALATSAEQGSFGCGTLVGFPAGAIAVVDRGTAPGLECPFTAKTLSAQAAGAVAVVIVNNVAGAPTAPGGSAPGITIPTVMISQADGAALKASLPASGRLQPQTTAINNAGRVGVESLAWGHEGGNDLSVQAVDPGTANSALAVTVAGNDITVSLATNATGARTSTAAQVVAALNAHPHARSLVLAHTYRGNAGAGIVPATPRHRLSDFLNAPAHVSREPMTVKVLRIGKHRDGSRVGVFGYAQEHAREWVTPLTALESAERLLRNYDNDDNTRKLVDDLDIFIAPSINPDGTHYSIHDFTMQRKNMTRYCGVTQQYDQLARTQWGVDLNRNFTVGSLFDGFAGASTNCTGETFAGPAELSEPEAKNEVWLTETFENIKFSMNIHSHGGYFMWAPGAYQQATRAGLVRPSYGTERYFYEASNHILNRIKEHRGTNIWDSRVGPISDVLYSAAGNSGDEHFYNRGIFAWSFEVGAPRRNAADTGWTSVGFTPPYEEGYEESQEFANGLLGMFEVARMYARDVIQPKAELVATGAHPAGDTYTFRVSEPADVYYTTDGSRPTYDSAKLAYLGPRQAEAEFVLPQGSSTVKWFSVDVRGNVEGNYDPKGKGQNFRQAKVTVK